MDHAVKRERMVAEQLIPRGIRDPRVLKAMGGIPRHRFVSGAQEKLAYEDYPLPIEHGQTISQPYIVALMTEALALKGDEKVLEIGTGSGYQAAVLAELSREVYTIEKIPELQREAMTVLAALGYTNISFKVHDGTLGWPEHQPFDAVIVTAGAPNVPQPLVEQLAEGGRLLIPVGDRYSQELIKVTSTRGKLIEEGLGGCRFVPLEGAYGW